MRKAHVLLAVCVVMLPVMALATGPAVYLPSPPSSASQAMAVSEMQRAIYAMSGDIAPAVRGIGEQPTLVIAVATDPVVKNMAGKDAVLRRAIERIAPGDYLMRRQGQDLLVTATTDDGLMGGVAGLLRAYGCGAFLGGDTFPKRAALPWPKAEGLRRPTFAMRGLLPWYNFWDSPTTWNTYDWENYLDEMSRQGMNLIAVHNYNNEPLCAYFDGKQWQYGQPLYTSAMNNWGCHPMKTSEFGYGTGAIYYQKYFGSDLATAGLKPAQAIEKEQQLFANAMAYAHARGMRTCLGFEVSGDPTDPAELKVLEARIRHVLEQYPLDYLWIWEPEGMGINGCAVPDPYSQFGTYVRRWHHVFAYLGNEKRIAEAVRMTLYTQAAREMVHAMNPRVRLAVAGWGGDHWLHVTDFFPGMDKLLPKDVIFSALDNISVTPNVSANYGEITGRDMWPCPWFEYDGDQWVQHSNARQWAGACADAKAKGCSGILGIHWRQRAVEESAAYMARYAWGDAGTLESFYHDVATEWFGPALAKDGEKVLLELQGLGYRWTGGGGESECGGLQWGPGRDNAKVAKLKEYRAELVRLADRAKAGEGSQTAYERLRWFIAMADWTLAYETTARAMANGGDIAKAVGEAQAAANQKAGDAAAQARHALGLLQALPFGEGLAQMAGTVSDRGELGTVASINCKAWWQIREDMRNMAAIAGQKLGVEPDLVKTLGTRLVVAERPTVAAAGQELRMRVGVLGGAQARITWRAWGGQWHTSALRPIENPAPPADSAVQEAVIPGAGVTRPGIEWHLEAAAADGSTDRFPTRGEFVTAVVAPWAGAKPQTVAVKPGAPGPVRNLKAQQLPYGGIDLTWNAPPEGGLLYTVTRKQGTRIDTIAVGVDNWAEDPRPMEGEATYSVVATYIGGKSGAAANIKVTQKPIVPPVPTGWKAEAGPHRIFLTLPPTGMETRAVRAYIRAPGETKWRAVADLSRPKAGVAGRAAILAPAGKPVEVTLAGVGLGGGESAKSAPQTVTPLAEEPKPVVLVAGATGDIMPGGQIIGDAKFGRDGARRALELKRGGVQMPLPDALKAPAGLTVACWYKPTADPGMPVLVDSGTWRQDGFFLQMIGSGFRWHVAPEDFDGGTFTIGKWQHVCGVWDGSEGRLYVNGKLVSHHAANLTYMPSGMPLFIGRYNVDQDDYYVQGSLTDVRIYDVALTAKEVAALAKE